MNVAYVMNRMGEGTVGDDRGIGIVFAAYGALAEEDQAGSSLRPSVAHQLAVSRSPPRSPRGCSSSNERL